ncbi:uncharacterized protein RHO17_004027 [Thomomys bottae]
MEESDSSDNENDPLVKHRRQRERLAREEAFYRFVNNLSNDDYKLMRDNNLLGAIGEKTEEELQRSLQRIKESTQMPGFYPDYFMPPIEPRMFNPLGGRPHHTGSVRDQFTSSFRQPVNMTEREQRVNQSYTATNQNNLNTSNVQERMDSNLRIHRRAANSQADSIFSRPSRTEVSATETATENLRIQMRAASTRADSVFSGPSRSEVSATQTSAENLRIQRQASSTQANSVFSRPSTSEVSTTEASTDIRSTIIQEREINRSTIVRKIRPRPELGSSSRSRREILWGGRNPETIERQTSSQSNSTFPGPSSSEVKAAVSSTNAPSPSGQKRERSRSPDSQGVRARNEDSSSPNSPSQIRRKVRNTGNTYRRRANSKSEATSVSLSTSEVTATETLMDTPPSRIQRRTRNRSPIHWRVRPRIENRSPAENTSFENIRVNEIEMPSRIQQHEAQIEQPNIAELCIKQLFAGLTATNDLTVQTDSNTGISVEPCVTRPRNQTPDSNLEVSFNPEREHSPRYNLANRSPLTTQTTNNTVSLESNEVNSPIHSNTEQSHESACITTTVSTQSKMHLNNATLVITQRTLCQITVEFDQAHNLTNNDSETDSNSENNNNNTDSEHEDTQRDESDVFCYNDCEHHNSSVIQNTQSEWGYESDESETYDSNQNPSWDSENSESSLIASYNSNNESSDNNFEESENSTDQSSPSNSPLENREENRPLTPTSDDFDIWPVEDQLEANEESPPSGGLSKRQIDMITVRNFNKSDVSNSCTICIEEFREGNKIRILPCCHTYHVHCIDAWLADNATCPICRRRINTDEREL